MARSNVVTVAMASPRKDTFRKVAPSGQSAPGMRDLECVPGNKNEVCSARHETSCAAYSVIEALLG